MNRKIVSITAIVVFLAGFSTFSFAEKIVPQSFSHNIKAGAIVSLPEKNNNSIGKEPGAKNKNIRHLTEYAPGKILVLCEPVNKNQPAPQGKAILQWYTQMADALRQKTNASFGYEPASKYIIEQMIQNDLTADEVFQKAVDQRAADKKLPPPQKIKGQSDAFSSLAQILVLRVPGSVQKVAKQLMEDPNIVVNGVAYKLTVELDRLYENALAPTDNLYPQQWAHPVTHADTAWNTQTGSSAIKVAVLDSGVTITHPDLAANIYLPPGSTSNVDFVDIDTQAYASQGYQLLPGEDYVQADTDPFDYNGHGTHCAGIVAAGINNGGIVGVCPNCKILPLRTGFSIMVPFDFSNPALGSYEAGALENSSIINAVTAAIGYGADVISMSFVGGHSALLDQVLQAAYSSGIVLVAATGNNNYGTIHTFPAALDNVISVGATDLNDIKASYSNYGDWVKVSAPGGDGPIASQILSTVPSAGGQLHDPSGYKAAQGTSMAAPYVAGLAALLFSQNPALTNEQVAGIILSTADNIDALNPGYTGKLGTGRVNVYKALQSVVQTQPAVMLDQKVIHDTNANGLIDANENISMIIALRNDSFLGTNLQATLSCPDPTLNVTIMSNVASYGSMNMGQVKDNTISPYLFKVGTPSSSGQPIPFTLTVTGAGNYSKVIHFTVPYGINLFTATDIDLPWASVTSTAWGDYDNDGHLDLLVAGFGIASTQGFTKLYHNNGNGTFSEVITNFVGAASGSIAWGDYDSDGRLDVVVSGWKYGGNYWGYFINPMPSEYFTPEAATKIYHNDGLVGNQWKFTDINANLPQLGWGSASWGDYDNDGLLDILLTGYNYPGSQQLSKVYHNDGLIGGQWQFTENTNAILPGIGWSSSSWGDYNNDGFLDILLVGNYVASIYRNNGNGTFTDIGAGLTTVIDGDAAWGDYDNDGYLDIVLSGYISATLNVTKAYHNDGLIGGQWQFTENASVQLQALQESRVAWGDYNNDGYLDILICGGLTGVSGTETTRIYRNDGPVGSQWQFTDINTNLPGVASVVSSWGDYDNDGDLDIAMGSRWGGVSIYNNNLGNNVPVVNTVPSAPPTLGASPSGQSVTLTWAKASDNQTPQSGLSYNLFVGTVANSGDRVSPMSRLSDGRRKVVHVGPHQNLTRTIDNLPNGVYYWGVQAIDTAFAGSPFITGTFIIGNSIVSGRVICSDDQQGVNGVQIKEGNTVIAITHSAVVGGVVVEGYYSFVKPNGWSGTVTAVLPIGYAELWPASRSYPNPPSILGLTANMPNQDYFCKRMNFSIQGKFFQALGQWSVPLSGAMLKVVTVSPSGIAPFNVVTASDGSYSFFAPYNWRGVVTPVKYGYTFSPANKQYTSGLNGNLINQNYIAYPILMPSPLPARPAIYRVR